MAVPSDGVTINYSWQVPSVGGDVGSWGGILNTVFGNHLTDAELETHADDPITPPPGIDQIVGLMRTDLTTAEGDINDLGLEVGVLETEVVPSFYARVVLTSAMNVVNAEGSQSLMTWDTTALFNEGAVWVPGTSLVRLVVPTNGEGAWQVRLVIAAPSWAGSSDDSNSWQIRVKQTGGAAPTPTVIAEARSIYANDGYNTDSGDISIMAEAIVEITTEDIALGVGFEAYVTLHQPDGGPTTPIQAVDYQTYFSAARIAPKDVSV